MTWQYHLQLQVLQLAGSDGDSNNTCTAGAEDNGNVATPPAAAGVNDENGDVATPKPATAGSDRRQR